MDCFTYLSRSGHRITKCFTSWLESCNLCFLLDGRFTSRLSFYAFLFLRPCLAGLLLSTLDFVPFLCILSCEALSDSVCVRCYVNKLYLPRYWRVHWGSGEAASKQTCVCHIWKGPVRLKCCLMLFENHQTISCKREDRFTWCLSWCFQTPVDATRLCQPSVVTLSLCWKVTT